MKTMEGKTQAAASYQSEEHQSQHQFEDLAADFEANQAARRNNPLHPTERMAAMHFESPPQLE